jgi:hypothetical protein
VSEQESYERLRASLDDAYDQADRLVREAEAQARESARELPPAGWASPGSGSEGERRGPPGVAELQALAGLLDLARQSVPPELVRQVLDALRQLLLAIRALIDYYVERVDRERETPPEVEDIPIQ